jgi:hypothetical protein
MPSPGKWAVIPLLAQQESSDLIGFTRLGNLLALLDREEVREIQKHLVWVGRGTI